jgi:hypothetical protein
MAGIDPRLEKQGTGGGLRILLRLVVVLLLVAAVAVEAYYISVIRKTIAFETEEIRNLSAQLQSSKDKRAELSRELSSMNKMGGEKKDGNTSDGQH